MYQPPGGPKGGTVAVEYIPLADCKHSGLYYVLSGHFRLAVYNEDDQTFVGIRDKLGHHYLFKIHHYDYDPLLGGVYPITWLEYCPVRDLSTDFSTSENFVINHALMAYMQDSTMQYRQYYQSSE